MQFAPDGRLFVCEQGGRLRVIKNGALLPTPFLTLTVSSSGERGLLGVAFDPELRDQPASSTSTTRRRRPPCTTASAASRPTATSPCRAAKWCILELNNLSSATNHNGGALHFGPDGKLYVAVGENAERRERAVAEQPARQDAAHQRRRLDPDRQPLLHVGDRQEPRDLGARPAQPVHVRVQPGTARSCSSTTSARTRGRRSTTGVAGANYGWPHDRGADNRSRASSEPRYAYNHAAAACAITGGAFYSPPTAQFPADYVGDYFFADYCGGWIRKLDPSPATPSTTFATGIASPVDLKVADDGSLYYLARGAGAATGVVFRITFGAASARPSRRTRPASTVAPGALGDVQRRARPGRRRCATSGSATAPTSPARPRRTYTIASVGSVGQRRAVPRGSRNDFGNVLSNEAVLTVTSNQRADRDDHAAGRRHALQRRQRHHLRGHRRPIPRTATLPASRIHVARGFPPRRPTRTRSSRRRPARPAGRSPFRRPATPRPTSGIAST